MLKEFYLLAGRYPIHLWRGLSIRKQNLVDCVHPCPCGFYGDTQKPCTCTHAMVTKYQKQISGPLLDRIDIHIEVPRMDYEKLSGDRMGETSESIRARVQAARNIQPTLFMNSDSHGTDIICNADMRVGRFGNIARCSTKVRA